MTDKEAFVEAYARRRGGVRYCLLWCGAVGHDDGWLSLSLSQPNAQNSHLETMSDRESEQVGDKLGDDFVISEDFVSSPNHKQATTNSLDLDGLLQNRLFLHEDLAQGNGGQAWPAGYVLAKYLLRKKRDELKHSSMFVGRVPYLSSIQ